MLKQLLRAVALSTLLGLAGAQAQTFPTRQVTIIVPFAAGGPSDVIARLIGEQMSKRLGRRSSTRSWPGRPALSERPGRRVRRPTATRW